jgi:hypothetical protein
MAASAQWQRWFPDKRAKEWRSHSLEFYYAALARSAKWLDLWATDYLQIMPDVLSTPRRLLIGASELSCCETRALPPALFPDQFLLIINPSRPGPANALTDLWARSRATWQLVREAPAAN